MKRLEAIQTPAYVIDMQKLEDNLKILRQVKEHTGCKILLAQKAFSAYHTYPLISSYLDGVTASGLYEARLGFEEFRGENHIFSPAFVDADMEEIYKICQHIVFNSFHQLQKYGYEAKRHGLQIGLRINPECSTQKEHAIYDPCASGSRLGVTISAFKKALESPEGKEAYTFLDGLHFHTLCEQGAEDLETTLMAVYEKFGIYLLDMKWLNFGGGHHITKKTYNIPLLERCITESKERYGVEIYLEPGEAVALDAGYLVSEVVDIIDNGIQIAILDTSAAAHMPDVLEMPYTPPLFGEKEDGKFSYRLAGSTCLSGDVIGDYTFDEALYRGKKLIFLDMAIYSMVKNNTFNGMPLPAIYQLDGENLHLIKAFEYADFKGRL